MENDQSNSIEELTLSRNVIQKTKRLGIFLLGIITLSGFLFPIYDNRDYYEYLYLKYIKYGNKDITIKNLDEKNIADFNDLVNHSKVNGKSNFFFLVRPGVNYSNLELNSEYLVKILENLSDKVSVDFYIIYGGRHIKKADLYVKAHKLGLSGTFINGNQFIFEKSDIYKSEKKENNGRVFDSKVFPLYVFVDENSIIKHIDYNDEINLEILNKIIK